MAGQVDRPRVERVVRGGLQMLGDVTGLMDAVLRGLMGRVRMEQMGVAHLVTMGNVLGAGADEASLLAEIATARMIQKSITYTRLSLAMI